jgi:hypothetical protein
MDALSARFPIPSGCLESADTTPVVPAVCGVAVLSVHLMAHALANSDDPQRHHIASHPHRVTSQQNTSYNTI